MRIRIRGYFLLQKFSNLLGTLAKLKRCYSEYFQRGQKFQDSKMFHGTNDLFQKQPTADSISIIDSLFIKGQTE